MKRSQRILALLLTIATLLFAEVATSGEESVPTSSSVRYRTIQLDDVDIAAVITYERNSLGNSVGDIVQPSDIKNAR